MSKNILLVGLAITLAFASGCAQGQDSATSQKGSVEGKVTIAPLCPVEPCQISTDQKARIYGARKIVIYTQDRAAVVKEISLDEDGYYRTDLNPGYYVVDINRLGIDSSSAVPKEVGIEAGQIIRLDIDIDTGIR